MEAVVGWNCRLPGTGSGYLKLCWTVVHWVSHLVSAKYLHQWQQGTRRLVCLLVGCLKSQQHASVSQGRICSDSCTCCHTEIEVADQSFYLTQSQYTDTGPTSPSDEPVTPDTWQSSHWSSSFKSMVWLDPEKSPQRLWESNPGLSALKANILTTVPVRLWGTGSRDLWNLMVSRKISLPLITEVRLKLSLAVTALFDC